MAKRDILPVDRLQKGEEDSWVNVLNAIKTKNCIRKTPTEF